MIMPGQIVIKFSYNWLQGKLSSRSTDTHSGVVIPLLATIMNNKPKEGGVRS